LLQAAGRSGLPVLLSTGMASLDEIALALGAIAFGISGSAEPPSAAAFRRALQSERSALLARATVLQCTTAYPAPPADINLRALDTLSDAFGLPVGFSDHSLGTVLAVAAAGRGAAVIEKHFTLDQSLPGPDHAASLEVDELTRMIADIRMVEQALGTGAKERRPSELENVSLARRGVYAARDLAAGEIVSVSDIALLRPESAFSPMELWDIAGKPARRSYRKFEAFER
jgi:N-acetylneuraminate synthase